VFHIGTKVLIFTGKTIFSLFFTRSDLFFPFDAFFFNREKQAGKV